MPILDKLFGAHVRNLESSLDRASQRQALLAANLANVNTPGYKRRDISFDIELESAARPMRTRNSEASRASSGSLRMDGNNVDLEHEVMAMAETELRYQALTEMTYRYFQGLRSVLRDSK